MADLFVQSLGLASALMALTVIVLGLKPRGRLPTPATSRGRLRLRALVGTLGVPQFRGRPGLARAAGVVAAGQGAGRLSGAMRCSPVFAGLLAYAHMPAAQPVAAGVFLALGLSALGYAIGLRPAELRTLADWIAAALAPKPKAAVAAKPERAAKVARRDRAEGIPEAALEPASLLADGPKVKPPKSAPKQRPARKSARPSRPSSSSAPGGFALPELGMLAKPKPRAAQFDEGALRQNAQLLEKRAGRVRGQGRGRPDPPRSRGHALRAGPGPPA